MGEFVDYASGASEQREEYQKMINQVRKRKVDVVLAWRYGRFAREAAEDGLQALIIAVEFGAPKAKMVNQ